MFSEALLYRNRGSIVEGLKHTFNHKGLIDVDRNASNLNLETAVDVAIEVGSEEVLETVDADGTNVIQVCI